MNLAFIFPGQASQKVGMGQDLYKNTKLGKIRYKQANDIMGMDIASLSFHGPEETLKQTLYAQPAIFIVSIILAELMITSGIQPDYAAGHSLGEYSALTSADVFSFEDALKLVKIRGETMHEAGNINPGTMAAIIGLDKDEIEEICKEASAYGIVQPANFNSQNQIVISGQVSAIQSAMKLARERKAMKVIELNVSGAFHSPLMAPAKEALREALESSKVKTPKFPIVMNVSAESVTDPETIKKNLIDQLDHPVRWIETIQNLASFGVTKFMEIGPGKVLQGLNKRIDRTLEVSGIETNYDMKGFASA